MIITPTFDSSITGNANAASIMASINAAIADYESLFTDNITVNIEFHGMGSGLGQSSKTLYLVPYSTFRSALAADATTADDATALAVDVPVSVNSPITGGPDVAISTANIKALNIAGSFPSILACGPTCDGSIGLNLNLTTPGGVGSSLLYDLRVVAQHEIDEVLGLGSSLAQSYQNSPMPFDYFRYGTAAGVRSYTTSAVALAYFSIDGVVHLAQFDNQNDGGDWGDWQSNPLPPGVPAQVQDAFSSANVHPVLNVELRALDVTGYDLVEPVPEPGTWGLLFSGLAAFGFVSRRRRRAR